MSNRTMHLPINLQVFLWQESRKNNRTIIKDENFLRDNRIIHREDVIFLTVEGTFLKEDVIIRITEEIIHREDAIFSPVMVAIKAVVKVDSIDLVLNTEMAAIKAAIKAAITEMAETDITTPLDKAADFDPAADRRAADSEDPDLHRADFKGIIVEDRLSTRNCLLAENKLQKLKITTKSCFPYQTRIAMR